MLYIVVDELVPMLHYSYKIDPPGWAEKGWNVLNDISYDGEEEQVHRDVRRVLVFTFGVYLDLLRALTCPWFFDEACVVYFEVVWS